MAPLSNSFNTLLGLVPLVLVVLDSSQAAVVPHPTVTPPPLPEQTPTRVQERDILGSIGGAIGTYTSGLGSAVPNFLPRSPRGSPVESSLGISSSVLAPLQTQALNLPGYANWTDQGWNLRFHGNIYRQPPIPSRQLDELANTLLRSTSVSQLPPPGQTQARNLTSEIFVVQQPNASVSFRVEPVANEDGGGGGNGGNVITSGGGAQNISLDGTTTVEGDYDQFLPLANVSGPGGPLIPGNETTNLQNVNVYVDGTDTGNATSYLVPNNGLTIVSDIDDVLRFSQVYSPSDAITNAFAKPFVPWMNMPDIYGNWSRSIPDFHFHYLSTTPEQVSRSYMDFVYDAYPRGSFDMRPLNFSDVAATLSIRKFLLHKIFETYPERKFILVGDTSNPDAMQDYPALAHEFPGKVQCIFIRNTAETDSSDKLPYNTTGFEGLDPSTYMFFLVPDDLSNLDIVNGQCLNASIRQNVTFGVQGLPLGIGDGKNVAFMVNIGWEIFAGVGLVMLMSFFM